VKLPRGRRLLLLSFLIWGAGGAFLFIRCGSEKRDILHRGVRLRLRMAHTFQSAARTLQRERNKKKLRHIIAQTGSSYASYLKQLRALDQRLFRASIEDGLQSLRSVRILSRAKRLYRRALVNRQRRK